MRKNLPVTSKEVDYSDALRIVSTTTAKGVIKYANDDFVKVAGYSVEELEGQAHNIVRHPDMPQAAFKSLWDTVGAGKPWMGLVKNRCKSGDHYWVDAFVMQAGEMTEGKHDLQSVRFKPSRSQIERASTAYKAINKGQTPYSGLNPYHWPMLYKTFGALLLAIIPLVIVLGMSDASMISFFGATGLAIVIAGILSHLLTSAIRESAARAKKNLHRPTSPIFVHRASRRARSN